MPVIVDNQDEAAERTKKPVMLRISPRTANWLRGLGEVEEQFRLTCSDDGNYEAFHQKIHAKDHH